MSEDGHWCLACPAAAPRSDDCHPRRSTLHACASSLISQSSPVAHTLSYRSASPSITFIDFLRRIYLSVHATREVMAARCLSAMSILRKLLTSGVGCGRGFRCRLIILTRIDTTSCGAAVVSAGILCSLSSFRTPLPSLIT